MSIRSIILPGVCVSFRRFSFFSTPFSRLAGLFKVTVAGGNEQMRRMRNRVRGGRERVRERLETLFIDDQYDLSAWYDMENTLTKIYDDNRDDDDADENKCCCRRRRRRRRCCCC
jgi:hypothetical protein